MNTTTVSFEPYRSTRITATLEGVTDSQLWLSAEAIGGGVTDSIRVNWSRGNRNNTIDALRDDMNINIGDVIIIDVMKSAIRGNLHGYVVGKVS